jgi:hypothetical protein
MSDEPHPPAEPEAPPPEHPPEPERPDDAPDTGLPGDPDVDWE